MFKLLDDRRHLIPVATRLARDQHDTSAIMQQLNDQQVRFAWQIEHIDEKRNGTGGTVLANAQA